MAIIIVILVGTLSGLITVLFQQREYHITCLRLERQRLFDLGREYGQWTTSAEYHKSFDDTVTAQRHLGYAEVVKASVVEEGVRVY